MNRYLWPTFKREPIPDEFNLHDEVCLNDAGHEFISLHKECYSLDFFHGNWAVVLRVTPSHLTVLWNGKDKPEVWQKSFFYKWYSAK